MIEIVTITILTLVCGVSIYTGYNCLCNNDDRIIALTEDLAEDIENIEIRTERIERVLENETPIVVAEASAPPLVEATPV